MTSGWLDAIVNGIVFCANALPPPISGRAVADMIAETAVLRLIFI
jgi:hypothetical protein